MNEQEAAMVARLVVARYPRAAVGEPKAMAKSYWLTLNDVPYELVEKVLSDWFKSEKWPPDVSEIRSRVLEVLAEIPTAEDAWSSVLRHMRDNGAIGGQPFAGPEVVAETVYAIGGWHRLRRSETPEQDREAFSRAYQSYAKRAIAQTKVLELIRDRTPELEAEVG